MADIVVEVATAEEKQTLLLIATYAHIQNLTIRDGATLCLQCGHDRLRGLSTICRYIASRSIKRDSLLGSCDTSRTQIMGWLSFRNMGLSPVTEEKLTQISEHLQPRMHLVDQLSLADLCLFAKLHRPLSHLPPAQAARYCNLIRWFEYIQYTADLNNIYPRVYFPKPGLPEFSQLPQKAQEPAKQSKPPSASTASGGKAQPPKAESGDSTAKAAQEKPNAGKAAAVAPSTEAAAGDVKDAKQAKKDARKEARKAAEPKKSDEARIDMLDLRIGQIVKVGHHPNADALYVEDIDVGEDRPRQVVSGLRKFVAEEQMLNRRVVVCLNLKPAKMRDVISYGMVLCASNKAHDKVDPLSPPAAAKIGDRITFSGFPNEPEAELNPKKKILEKLKEDLQTDSVGVATYKSVPFMCAGSPVISSIPSGSVG